jgi:DNA (cytosine-5)-methyltransferase 1
MRKSTTYSEIKKKLKIEIDSKTDNGLANLTHFWQNSKNGVSQYFKPLAKEYLSELHEKLNIVSDPDFNFYLPLNFDIPFPPPKNPKFTFIDLFAGIGGIRLAYQNLGGKCVFTSEWDRYSKMTYDANFGEIPFGDITKIDADKIPDHDILLGGFPCQPFSIAGVSKKNALAEHMDSLMKLRALSFLMLLELFKLKDQKHLCLRM